MGDTPLWMERNGEVRLPDIGADECKYFWFDGVATYQDWRKTGQMIVYGDMHTDRVMGLVFLMLTIDMKHPQIDGRGGYVRTVPMMFAVPESGGYELSNCHGKWYGPVVVPEFTDGFLPSLAYVEELDRVTDAGGTA